jgi:ribonuclease D
MSDSEVTAIEIPLLKNPRVSDIRFVANAEELDRGIRDILNGEGPLGVDAERASGFKYSQRAYLVQLFRTNGPILLIDPISVLTDDQRAFERLQAAIADLEWVLHAARQDLPCLSELGLRPNKLFDTELAGRLAGFDKVGLGSIVARCLGFQLAKEHSAVDWSTRPLQESWLTYAALDVDVLPELRNAMHQELAAQNKLEWAEQEFASLCQFQPKPPKVDRWRGVSGLHSVKDQRALAIAKTLWEARETLAIKLDVSPSRLLPDSSILEVVNSKPRGKAELAANKKFAGRASRSYLDTWWQAIERGNSTMDLPPLRMPLVGIPNHRTWATKHPEKDARLQRVKAVVAELARNVGMPTENLLAPEALRTICWEFDGESEAAVKLRLSELGVRDWQAALTSQPIAAALPDPPTTGQN